MQRFRESAIVMPVVLTPSTAGVFLVVVAVVIAIIINAIRGWWRDRPEPRGLWRRLAVGVRGVISVTAAISITAVW